MQDKEYMSYYNPLDEQVAIFSQQPQDQFAAFWWCQSAWWGGLEQGFERLSTKCPDIGSVQSRDLLASMVSSVKNVLRGNRLEATIAGLFCIHITTQL